MSTSEEPPKYRVVTASQFLEGYSYNFRTVRFTEIRRLENGTVVVLNPDWEIWKRNKS